MSFIRGVSQTFVSQGVSSIFQLLTGIVTARYLGVEGRGFYSLVFTWGAIIATMFSLGLSQATVYFRNRKNIDNSQLAGNILFFLVIQMFLIGSILFLLPDGLLEKFIPSNHSIGIIVYWLLVVILLSDNLISGVVLANHRFLLNGYYIAIQNILIFIVAAPAVFYTLTGELAVIYRVQLLVFIALIYWFTILRKLKINKVTFDGKLLLSQLAFGVKNFLQNLIGLLNYRVAILILGMLTSLKEVALYSVALILVEAIRFIPNVIGTVLLPKLTTLNQTELAGFAARTFRIIILANLIIAPVLIFLSEWIILLLFGEDYIGAVTATKYMIVGGMLGSVYQVFTRVFTSQAKQKYSIIAAIFGLVFSVVGLIILIPNYSVTGAGIAFLLGNLITAIFMIMYFIKEYKVTLIDVLIPTKLDMQFIFIKLNSVNIFNRNSR